MMLIYSIAGGASFIFVFLKAFQQRNVAFDKYKWILPTSICMGFVEVYVITAVSHTDGFNPILALVIGFGAGTGALLAARLHKIIFAKKDKSDG